MAGRVDARVVMTVGVMRAMTRRYPSTIAPRKSTGRKAQGKQILTFHGSRKINHLSTAHGSGQVCNCA